MLILCFESASALLHHHHEAGITLPVVLNPNKLNDLISIEQIIFKAKTELRLLNQTTR